jgi:biopolymer transport protein ExbD
MVRSAAWPVWFAAAGIVTLGVAVGGAATAATDAPPSQKPVTLTINPDGTAVWNGVPLGSEPALKDKIARQTQQAPRLELDLQFHSVGQLSDSNRQTLLDIVELTARYGFVHVEAHGDDGVTLTVLGPHAAAGAVPK